MTQYFVKRLLKAYCRLEGIEMVLRVLKSVRQLKLR